MTDQEKIKILRDVLNKIHTAWEAEDIDANSRYSHEVRYVLRVTGGLGNLNKKNKKEDRGRLNLPTQDFPNKLSVSIGQPVGGTDITHQEGYTSYKIKGLMKEIKGINEEMVSGQGMDDIEDLIDKYGLEGICDAISHICGEKADHVRSTWQDEPMAKAWEKNAKLFDALTSKLASTT